MRLICSVICSLTCLVLTALYTSHTAVSIHDARSRMRSYLRQTKLSYSLVDNTVRISPSPSLSPSFSPSPSSTDSSPSPSASPSPSSAGLSPTRIMSYRNTSVKMQNTSDITDKGRPRVVLMLSTHNRIGYVETFARAIAMDPAMKSGQVHLVVRDDASSTYGYKELREWFPQATIIMQAERHKSDMNIRNNFEWFVKQEEYNLMVSIDSDSILDPLWLPFINDHMPSSGFATLYHSGASYHKTRSCAGVWCTQKSTGSLGMVMTKTLAKQMLLQNTKAAFDWGIVAWLDKKKIPILAPIRSLVLHYGYYGQNNTPKNMLELADGFNMTSIHKNARFSLALIGGCQNMTQGNTATLLIFISLILQVVIRQGTKMCYTYRAFKMHKS